MNSKSMRAMGTRSRKRRCRSLGRHGRRSCHQGDLAASKAASTSDLTRTQPHCEKPQETGNLRQGRGFSEPSRDVSRESHSLDPRQDFEPRLLTLVNGSAGKADLPQEVEQASDNVRGRRRGSEKSVSIPHHRAGVSATASLDLHMYMMPDSGRSVLVRGHSIFPPNGT